MTTVTTQNLGIANRTSRVLRSKKGRPGKKAKKSKRSRGDDKIILESEHNLGENKQAQVNQIKKNKKHD